MTLTLRGLTCFPVYLHSLSLLVNSTFTSEVLAGVIVNVPVAFPEYPELFLLSSIPSTVILPVPTFTASVIETSLYSAPVSTSPSL